MGQIREILRIVSFYFSHCELHYESFSCTMTNVSRLLSRTKYKLFLNDFDDPVPLVFYSKYTHELFCKAAYI